MITAAHCTEGDPASSLYVLVGDTALGADYDTKGRIIQVERKIEHPRYDQPTRFENDIAILILSETLDLTSSPLIKPACLPAQDQDFYRQVGNIS